MGGDHGAVALDHAPVHAAVVISAEITHRHLFELGPADIGAGRPDQVVPAAIRIKQCRRCRVLLSLRRRVHACEEFLARVEIGSLLRKRQADRRRRSHPGRRRPVDRAALRLGNPVPGVAIGGMQPAAAEINRTQRVVADRPRPPAEPRARFEQQAINLGVPEPPARSNAGSAAADNHHLGITACHVSFCDNLERQGRPRRGAYDDRPSVDGFCGAIPPQSYSGARPPADIGDHPCTERSWPAFYLKTSIVAAIRMRGSARTLRRSTHDLVRRNRRWRRRSRDSRHASIMNRRPARNQIEGSVVIGVGTALFENRSYDRRGGEGRAGSRHEAESRASSRRKQQFA